MFYTKRIEISNIIIMNIQSNPMSSNIRVLIKVYNISPIFYFSEIISRINPIKSWFILIIFFLFQNLSKDEAELPASVADAAAVNPKGVKTLLVNSLITFFTNGNPVFINGPSNLPRNPPDCIILDN